MLFDLKFEVCQLSCEINKVDLEEYSYIMFIKDMKQCIANKKEDVQLYVDENIKVEAKMSNGKGKYIINSDENMMFVFK